MISVSKKKALYSTKFIRKINEYSKNSPLSIKVIGFDNKKAKYVSNKSKFGSFIDEFINMNDNILEAMYRTLDGYSNSLIDQVNRYSKKLNEDSLDNKIDSYSNGKSFFKDNIKDAIDISEDNIKGLEILKNITSFNILTEDDLDSNNIYYLDGLQLNDINNYFLLFKYTEKLEEYHTKMINMKKSIMNTINSAENIVNKSTNSSNDEEIKFYFYILKTCMKELSNISNIILYLINVFCSTIVYNYNACYIINTRNNK